MDSSDKDTSIKKSAGAAEEARAPQERRSAPAKKASRMDRLKKKVRKLQGKNPDIYPMW